MSKHTKPSEARTGSILGYSALAVGVILAIALGRQGSSSGTPHPVIYTSTSPVGDLAPDAGMSPLPTTSAVASDTPGPIKRLINRLPGGSDIPNDLVPFVAYMKSISAPHRTPHVTVTRHGSGRTVTVTATTRRGIHVRAAVTVSGSGHVHGHVRVVARLTGQHGATVVHVITTSDALTAVSVAAVSDAIHAATPDVPTPADSPTPTPTDTPTPEAAAAPSPTDTQAPSLLDLILPSIGTTDETSP